MQTAGQIGSEWESGKLFPLTPALSPGERESAALATANPIAFEPAQHGSQKLPLLGERVRVREVVAQTFYRTISLLYFAKKSLMRLG